VALRRDDLASDDFVASVQALLPPGYMTFTTPEEREESLRQTLACAPDGDIWLFGYGSLMWNPAIQHEEHKLCLLRGWHRRFCLWTPIGRGTPEQPGLVLGLERGGSCRGMAFRIPRAVAEDELRMVWRREMLTGGYVPRWVRVEAGTQAFRAVTFVINREGQRYAGRLCEHRTAATIATAGGFLGTCRAYLEESIRALEAHGIRDRHLVRLHHLVSHHQRA
ncbi:MAG: gamma-glutamylcyclotransferase, partial [Zavarzinia sp.]|nr:gamma-glutamylcyclotransferase [Zavarzinia sp.]